ncbi:amidohydrolase [Bacillus marinisedimentorum]|uniref:amidohydrolase n=1 Tax=Bacillus marinisedimentorum TaxID=1821260 RepID=UPI00316ABE36
MENDQDTVEALVTDNGKILAGGPLPDLKERYHDLIEDEINLDGGVMYPGFTDSHLHIIGHGEKLLRLDLSRCTSSGEMASELRRKAKETEPGEWILGEGWNENRFVDRKIFHREELDEISPHAPMLLTRVCRHAVLVNSEALRLANITAETPNPPGGIIVKDHEGEPTGFLLDTAQELVKAVVPQVSEAYIQKALHVSISDLLKMGLTGGHSEDLNYYGGFDRTYRAFTNIIDGKEIKFRADLLVHHGVAGDMAHQGYGYMEGTSFVRFTSVKIFADGALGGRTALLSSPYTDAPETSGVPVHSQEQLKSIVAEARSYNMPVAVHTIGDEALRMTLDAVEANPPAPGQRDRFVHGQILTGELLERIKNTPCIIDIQPQFVLSDFPWVIERLGEERIRLSYAWKTMLDYGVLCAGGSDAPIEEADPLQGIYAAVTRRKPEETETYLPDERLSPYEAVRLYTVGSAQAVCEEHERGLIKAGYRADFTVLDRDLFKIPADEILEAQVRMTIVDDTVQYEN